MFKRANILKFFGLLLIIALIYFTASYFPWFDIGGRLYFAMFVPVALLGGWEVFQRARAQQADNQLASAVVSQAKADRRPSADVVQLRERFEEAIAMLKQQKKRGGMGLYELPWYVIIGAPGSGKTTALKYSGLKFPLEQRSGKGALRGVGGTRNCDWWFTEEAVLLDTAGRYTTQDSDAAADSAGWAEFLALLKKHRKRRPLNGVLLAISAQDLMTQGQAGREAHVAAARRRLNELNKELRIQLPVYVLVTKCDLIAGFAEYFEDMSQQDRAQVLGVTFPKDVTLKGTAAEEFPAEFDAVVQRLNERVYARLEGEADGRRRASIFGFPQQIASMREGLAEFIGEVFESTRFDQRVLLRGVYFTSGTQEGTPIDRLLGALSRRFSVAAEAVALGARGKAYFIERLMKDVILAESGLAGVSRRLEIQTAVAQFGLYFGMLALGAIGLLLLTNSYRTNREFLEDFERRTETLRRSIPPAGDSAVSARPRLDQIRELIDGVEQYRAKKWWTSRGWGLGQSDSVEGVIANFYKGELQRTLVRTVKEGTERRLERLINGGDPLDLYQTLRAYLMLQGTRAPHFDAARVRDAANEYWKEITSNRSTAESLDRHFAWLLVARFSESNLKTALADRARQAIPAEATPSMILSLVKRNYEKSVEVKGQPPPSVIQAGDFQTRSRRALGEGLSPVFTKDAFAKMDELIIATETQFRTEKWFWGDRTPPEPKDTRNTVWRQYEAAYIAAWEGVLGDLGMPANRSEIGTYIQDISGDHKGLKPLFVAVDEHTSLVKEVYQEPPKSFLSNPLSYLAAAARHADQYARGQDAQNGAKITAHFDTIHWLVTPVGDGALIDKMLEKLRPVGTATAATKGGVMGGPASSQATADVTRAVQELQQTTRGLPGSAASLAAFIDEAVKTAVEFAGAGSNREAERIYSNFAAVCQNIIRGGYPFQPESMNDVPTDDLKPLFGTVFTTMVDELARNQFIELRQARYVSKTLPDNTQATPSDIIVKLNEIKNIRDHLMPNGEMKFRFDVPVRDLLGLTDTVKISEALFEGNEYLYQSTAKALPQAVWPAAGELVIRFSNKGQSESFNGTGSWNLFRLLSKASKLTKLSDTVFVVEFKTPTGMGAEFRIQATTSKNPLVLFESKALQSFRCDK
jgi:type VI secretion system protein ImpL